MSERLRDSALLRWSVLVLISFSMLCGYIISDIIAPLKPMLEQAPLLWDSTDYGIFNSGYGWLNIFFLMLIIGGVILDRKGVRFTGVLSMFIMLAGTALKYWAIQTTFEVPVLHLPFGLAIKKQVLFAAFGFAVFGVGVEMIGITSTKAVVRWFKGKEMAMAIGMNTAFGRIGTMIAMNVTPRVADHYQSVGTPLLFGLALLIFGLMTFLVFGIFDRKLDREEQLSNAVPEEGFRLGDIGRIASNSGFWLITALCILFYSAVFPFLKYAPDLMVQKFGVSLKNAGDIPSLLPLGTLFLTPFFGGLYDHKGRGATIMIVGSVLLIIVHVLFSVPGLDSKWIAVLLTVLLGIAFSLVPSAMWPSVAKIIPESYLGTAYSMIFWVQNIGLSGVPLLVGYLLDNYCRTGMRMIDGALSPSYDYSLVMMVFALCGVMALIFALLLRRDDRRKGYGLELPNIKK